ncbi:hypothetical protein IWZ03DRAFT_357025 [Phyllosticta citriasiana]|uniref:Uncharacterized protein n=1 Tax=Phyllosticta citriasiana TaxID=595635 RepID=A0ABR1L182_9PEZI
MTAITAIKGRVDVRFKDSLIRSYIAYTVILDPPAPILVAVRLVGARVLSFLYKALRTYGDGVSSSKGDDSGIGGKVVRVVRRVIAAQYSLRLYAEARRRGGRPYAYPLVKRLLVGFFKLDKNPTTSHAASAAYKL